MKHNPSDWAILPAGNALFGKNKITAKELTGVWENGSVVVCKKPNGQFHWIAGSKSKSGPMSLYAEIGAFVNVYHDQTFARIGRWEVVNQFDYELDGENLKIEHAVKPVIGVNMVQKAGLHVFK